MTLVIAPYCVIVVAVLVLGALVLRANPGQAANRNFAFAALATAAWVFGILGRVSGSSRPELWLRMSFAAASMIPATILLFVEAYPSPGPRRARRLTRLALALGTSFAIVSLTTNWLFVDPVVTAAGLSRKPGPLYTAFALYILSSWLLALCILAHKTWAARGAARAKLQYLTVAIGLGSVGATTTNLVLPLMTGRSSYTWLGPFFSLFSLVLVAHAVIRHRLFDLRVIIHRSITVLLATIASLIPAGIVLVWFGSTLSLGFQSSQFPIFLAAVLGSVLLATFMRDWVGRLLDLYVYRTRTNYRMTVHDVSKALTRVLDMRTLLAFVRDRLTDIFKPDGIAIYVFGGGVSRSMPDHIARSPGSSAPESLPDSIRALLRANQDVLELAEVCRGGTGQEPLCRLMIQHNWALVVPLLSDDLVIGAMAVGPKLSGDAYDPHDLDLLATISNQAGIAVKNAQLYAEVVLANEYVENIVATINSGVIAVNAAGRVTLFNRAAEELTGLSATAVQGRSLSVLPACLGEPLTGTVAGGRAVTYPEIALGSGAIMRPVICTVTPLRDAAGTILGSVAVFSDLSPLQELELERRRAEKLGYFKSLAAGFAHEIKNPLVSIKTFIQLVPQRLDDRRWLEEFSRIVQREIERLERLLQRLAALGRAREHPQGLLDLRLPIREALEFLQPEFAERRIRVTADLGEEPRTIFGDHDEVKQLAHNILLNALQHTPLGAGVTVELVAVEDRAILRVADGGPGISPELLERIFDPFFTRRKGGTGLGLAICTGIAAAHRAHLTAANHAGGGAIFTVQFPLVTALPTTAPA